MHGASEKRREDFFHTAGPALFSGAAQAILFNPFDRALYLRVKYRRQHFIDRRNFERPFHGFMNAAVYRTLVGASYIFWQDSARIFIERSTPEYFHVSQSPRLNAFLIGTVAGSLNGVILNGMQVVKYRMWGLDGNAKFLTVAKKAYRESGISIFFRGVGATALRDTVFGIVYEMLRHSSVIKNTLYPYIMWVEQDALSSSSSLTSAGTTSSKDNATTTINNDTKSSSGKVSLQTRGENYGACAFVFNLIAAVVASIVSSPFNYARSVIYGAPSGSVPMRCMPLLHSFLYQLKFVYTRGESFTDAKTIAGGAEKKEVPFTTNGGRIHSDSKMFEAAQHKRRELLERVFPCNSHPLVAWRWLNSRLNIGWGSLRVGLGMAVGQSLFHYLQDNF